MFLSRRTRCGWSLTWLSDIMKRSWVNSQLWLERWKNCFLASFVEQCIRCAFQLSFGEGETEAWRNGFGAFCVSFHLKKTLWMSRLQLLPKILCEYWAVAPLPERNIQEYVWNLRQAKAFQFAIVTAAIRYFSHLCFFFENHETRFHFMPPSSLGGDHGSANCVLEILFIYQPNKD